MKLFKFLLFVSVLFCGSCSRERMPVQSVVSGDSSVPVEFVLAGYDDTLLTKGGNEMLVVGDSPFAVGVKPWPVDVSSVTKVSTVTTENLGSFYMNRYNRNNGAKDYNFRFLKCDDGKFRSEGHFWPAATTLYWFYASNVALSGTVYHYVPCPSDVDVVLANATVSATNFGTVIPLTFRHAYARIGEVSVVPKTNPSAYSAVLRSATIRAPKSGNYNFGNTSFISTSDTVDIALTAANDVYVVPGTYHMTATFDLVDRYGVTTESITRSGDVQLTANRINDIYPQVSDHYHYDLSLMPSGTIEMDVRATRDFRAYLNIYSLPDHTMLNTVEVTDSTGLSFSSTDSSVGTFSGRTLTALAPGQLKVGAAYRGYPSDNTTVNVIDWIESYDNPVVTLSYSPSTIVADGGNAVPSVSYSQVAHYASGATTTLTSGGSVTYSKQSGVSAFIVDSSTGVVTVAVNDSEDSRSAVMQATVTMNGKSGSGTATVIQNGAIIINFDD